MENGASWSGILVKLGDIYIGSFVMNKAEGLGRQDIYQHGEMVGTFEVN